MNVNTKTYMPNMHANENTKELRTNFTQKLSKEESLAIRVKISENSKAIMLESTSLQVNIVSSKVNSDDLNKEFQSFLNEIDYSGKAIGKLSEEEASKLVSEDGIFGIEQTSQRIANFVIEGSGANEDMLRAGREGMIQGFKEAEAMWGTELPEISQKTMQAAIEMLDKAMNDLGFSIINKEA